MNKFDWNDGLLDYDYENDSLLIYSKKNQGEYAKSYSFDNFIIDVNSKNQVISYEFLDASKIFNVPKIALNRNVKIEGNFNIEKEKKRIFIAIILTVKYRNEQRHSDFKRELTRDDIQNIVPSKASITAS